ncbi:energy-coupling factor ABC transporter ATP-binding protein [Collinsella sp. AGMB00827]|uniref:Energy-coupling factor ABC transporter ATP-binding protein n=1 Tax=Collinsella ureilytica TaxID=2869515 RepID=A0ABS7MI62_9ACTN|nr:ABC transporter ATP-binding protein [Collinsella urealyticum]MBY4797054.1 energy-coupling factor ABC transporter ATP-binding protein [Collinsella urealyticum]
MNIVFRDVSFCYSNGVQALSSVSVSIDGLEPVAVVGKNGSGKTTLLKHLNGMLSPTKGQVCINGVDVTTRATAEWAQSIGYVFQNPDDQLFLESVRAELEFGPKQIGLDHVEIRHRVDVISKLIGLEDVLDCNPYDLSPSEKKFCAFGSVLTMRPSILVLDEPTCGQDARDLDRLADIIARLQDAGCLVMAVSHDMRFVARWFPQLIVMCEGAVLAAGETHNLLMQKDLLERACVLPPPVTQVALGAGIRSPVSSVAELIRSVEQGRNDK